LRAVSTLVIFFSRTVNAVFDPETLGEVFGKPLKASLVHCLIIGATPRFTENTSHPPLIDRDPHAITYAMAILNSYPHQELFSLHTISSTIDSMTSYQTPQEQQ
jgi:hypothetical protein